MPDRRPPPLFLLSCGLAFALGLLITTAQSPAAAAAAYAPATAPTTHASSVAARPIPAHRSGSPSHQAAIPSRSLSSLSAARPPSGVSQEAARLPWTSLAVAAAAGTTLAYLCGRHGAGRRATYLHSEDPKLTIGTGEEVPQFMQGKTVDVVLDLGRLREQLNGVSVCLVGMAGCQHRPTGKNLADALQYAPMDIHQLLNDVTGETPAAVLLRDGKAEFVQAEQDILQELCAYRHVVVTTGADMVMEKYNWSHMRHLITVYLNAPAEVLAKNLEEEGADAVYLFEQEVGLADVAGTLTERIQAVLDQRAAVYAQADVTVDADARPDVVAMRVAQSLLRLLDDNADYVQKLRVPGEITIDRLGS
eukprot:EG_transcript_11810